MLGVFFTGGPIKPGCLSPHRFLCLAPLWFFSSAVVTEAFPFQINHPVFFIVYSLSSICSKAERTCCYHGHQTHVSRGSICVFVLHLCPRPDPHNSSERRESIFPGTNQKQRLVIIRLSLQHRRRTALFQDTGAKSPPKWPINSINGGAA